MKKIVLTLCLLFALCIPTQAKQYSLAEFSDDPDNWLSLTNLVLSLPQEKLDSFSTMVMNKLKATNNVREELAKLRVLYLSQEHMRSIAEAIVRHNGKSNAKLDQSIAKSKEIQDFCLRYIKEGKDSEPQMTKLARFFLISLMQNTKQ